MVDYYTPEMGNIEYNLKGAIRSLPIAPSVIEALSKAVAEIDPSLTVVVRSGAQPAKGRQGIDRKGSPRHNAREGSGYAVDFHLERNGQVVPMGSTKTPSQTYLDVAQKLAERGFKGLGHYGWGLHADMVSPGMWGPDTRYRSISPAFRDAVIAGVRARETAPPPAPVFRGDPSPAPSSRPDNIRTATRGEQYLGNPFGVQKPVDVPTNVRIADAFERATDAAQPNELVTDYLQGIGQNNYGPQTPASIRVAEAHRLATENDLPEDARFVPETPPAMASTFQPVPPSWGTLANFGPTMDPNFRDATYVPNSDEFAAAPVVNASIRTGVPMQPPQGPTPDQIAPARVDRAFDVAGLPPAMAPPPTPPPERGFTPDPSMFAPERAYPSNSPAYSFAANPLVDTAPPMPNRFTTEVPAAAGPYQMASVNRPQQPSMPSLTYGPQNGRAAPPSPVQRVTQDMPPQLPTVGQKFQNAAGLPTVDPKAMDEKTTGTKEKVSSKLAPPVMPTAPAMPTVAPPAARPQMQEATRRAVAAALPQLPSMNVPSRPVFNLPPVQLQQPPMPINPLTGFPPGGGEQTIMGLGWNGVPFNMATGLPFNFNPLLERGGLSAGSRDKSGALL